MKNKGLKLLLLSQIILISVYTIFAFCNEGINLFSVFLTNIQNLKWNGQFNVDFSSYLLLSGLWIMWRNKYSTFSILFGIIASILGIIVFAPYILYLLWIENGNLEKVLTGTNQNLQK